MTSRRRCWGDAFYNADDDDFLRVVSSRILGEAGAVCLTARTHPEAMAIVAREPALELVILDFQMPDGDIGLLMPDFLEKPWKIGMLVRAIGHRTSWS